MSSMGTKMRDREINVEILIYIYKYHKYIYINKVVSWINYRVHYINTYKFYNKIKHI